MTEPRALLAAGALAAAALGSGCWRGRLPAREFYRLAPPDSAMPPTRSPLAPPLSGAMVVAAYHTPGIYATGNIVYRMGATAYGMYPSREWAIPLGEMLGALSEAALRRSLVTAGQVIFGGPASRRGAYEWRGDVREFDEVDDPAGVSASVVLVAQLVRVADDSVIWSGTAREREAVAQARSMDAVVRALSTAAARAVERLAGEAAASLRREAAAGARGR